MIYTRYFLYTILYTIFLYASINNLFVYFHCYCFCTNMRNKYFLNIYEFFLRYFLYWQTLFARFSQSRKKKNHVETNTPRKSSTTFNRSTKYLLWGQGRICFNFRKK